jgi:hypothetical protein
MSMILVPSGYAGDTIVPLTLDKVIFQLSAKRWVSTQTALLSVAVNATLSSTDLVKARADMMTKLVKIVSGDWHITQFERYQDSSGLEKLDVLAQVRVNQSALNRVYDTVKLVSKAGETYTVSAIDFKPGLEEIQTTKLALRQQLNKQIQQELAELNHIYSEQHFTLNKLEYLDESSPSPLRNKAMMMTVGAKGLAPEAPISVSNELFMTAVVEAASVRK